MAQVCNSGLLFTGTRPFKKVFTQMRRFPPKFTCFPSYIGPGCPYLPQVAFPCTPLALEFAAKRLGQPGPPLAPASSLGSARLGSLDLVLDKPGRCEIAASAGGRCGAVEVRLGRTIRGISLPAVRPTTQTPTPLMTAQGRDHSNRLKGATYVAPFRRFPSPFRPLTLESGLPRTRLRTLPMRAQKKEPGYYLRGALRMMHLPASFPSHFNRSHLHRVTQDLADDLAAITIPGAPMTPQDGGEREGL